MSDPKSGIQAILDSAEAIKRQVAPQHSDVLRDIDWENTYPARTARAVEAICEKLDSIESKMDRLIELHESRGKTP